MALHPGLALQQAILAALRADPALKAALGGPRIHDAVPARTAYPYVAYGPASVRDWSSGSGSGHEHGLTVTAVSRLPGFEQVYGVMAAVTERLDGASLTLPGHRLVLLVFEGADFRRDADGLTSRAASRFRALTEPA